MTEDKVYNFLLLPGKKVRHIAGPYDVKALKPHYELKIDVPRHVRDLVEVNQILLGTPENCQWAWDINNKSTWPAFVTILKDGKRT